MPNITVCGAVISVEATTPENATIDATDRSTSPSSSTNIMVTEIEPISVTDSNRPCMLRLVRKSGTGTDSTANKKMNKITMPDLLIRSHVRAACDGAPGCTARVAWVVGVCMVIFIQWRADPRARCCQRLNAAEPV